MVEREQLEPTRSTLKQDRPVRPPGQAPARRRGPLADFAYRLVREKPLGAFGGLIFLALLVTALFADVLAPYEFNAIHPADRLQPSSAKYWLGTDQIGRDVLSRLIRGATVSVIIATATAFLSIVLSILIGVLTGYLGGRVDMVFQRFVDAWMCFPDLIILIVAVALLGPGMGPVIIVLSLLYGIDGSRIIRGAVIGVKGNVYVQAAEAAGSTTFFILWRHILPNIAAPVIVLFTTRMALVILVESGLSFLGLGVPPPEASWGGMLSIEGRSYMFHAPWLAIYSGIAITITVYGINMFGDALRDLLDPRLRGGGGRYGRGAVTPNADK